MKNIITILEEVGITVAEEQKEALVKSVNENYKTVAEFEKKDAKITALTEKVKTTEEALSKFEGVDAEALSKQITELKEELVNKDKAFEQRMADRDFDALLKESIASAKGLNATAITSLLDVPTLKASTNQKEDIANALKNLQTAEDSKMLFASPDVPTGDKMSPIGAVRRNTNAPNNLDELYKGNPYYKPKN